MASNVSKCAQTFSASVMTYVQTKELELQCHCIALNTVKMKLKKFKFMASNVSKYAQLSSASVACVAVSNADKRNQLKQLGFMASNVPKKCSKIQNQCYDLWPKALIAIQVRTFGNYVILCLQIFSASVVANEQLIILHG